MLVLGIDTATEQLGLALAREDRVIAELGLADGLRHCERLIAGVDGLLSDLGLMADDLGGIAVTAGPGSFTGLRIGVAAAQGLAAARGVQVASISTLESLALAALPAQGTIVPCLDARRGEVYFCSYRVRGETFERLTADAVAAPAHIPERIGEGAAGRVVVLGTAAKQVVRAFENAGRSATCPPFASPYPRPGHVALLGARTLREGGGIPPEAVEPVYLRRPDAERGPKQAAAGGP